MPKPLSHTMRSAIEYMKENHNRIVRHPGGFWAKETWRLGKPSFGTSTVEALVDRGVAVYTQSRQGKGPSFPIEAELVEPGKGDK